MVQYKVLRFDLKAVWTNNVKKDGVDNLEKRLNELAKQGYVAKFSVEEYEGLTSRKAIILEKEY